MVSFSSQSSTASSSIAKLDFSSSQSSTASSSLAIGIAATTTSSILTGPPLISSTSSSSLFAASSTVANPTQNIPSPATSAASVFGNSVAPQYAVGEALSLSWQFTTEIHGVDNQGNSFVELSLFGTTNQTYSPALYLPTSDFDHPDTARNDTKIGPLLDQSRATEICQSEEGTISAASDPCKTQLFSSGATIGENDRIHINTFNPASLPFKSYYFGLKYVQGNGSDGGNDGASVSFYSNLFYVDEAGSPSSSSAVSTSEATSTPNSASASSGHHSNGLSAGAKAGIAIGVVGGLLLLILAALLLWRRNKKRTAYSHGHSSALAYSSHNFNNGDDQRVEKEVNVTSIASSPYETVERHHGTANIPPAVHELQHDIQQDPRGSLDDTAGDPQRANRESYYDRALQFPAPPPAPTPPPNLSSSPIQAQTETALGGMSHLHEPGMSPEELARLDEEERRLDEAIAEAERRRV